MIMLDVRKITIEEFENNCYEEYTNLFAKNERRNWEKIKKAYYNNFEIIYGIYDDNNLIGFFMLEKLDNYPYYLDYFGIFKKYQSMGYGSKAIKILLDKIVKDDGLIGEIDEVKEEDPVTIKRWKFYEKLGFKKYDDVLFALRVVFNLIIYPENYKASGEEIAKILMKYYVANIGEEDTKKICRIIKK